MGITRTVAKNSLVIFSSKICIKILSFVFVIFVARYLGDAGFGRYSFVFALLSFYTVFIPFGMDILIVREVAKDKTKSNAYLVNSALLKSLFSFIAWLSLLSLVVIMKKPASVNWGILIIGIGLWPDSLVGSFKSVFSAHEKMECNASIEIVFRSIIVGLGLAVVFLKLNLVSLFLASLTSSIITFIFSANLYRKKIGEIKLAIDYSLCRYLLKTGYAFALTGVFVAIYYRIDTVMISFMKGDAPVGWYSAAYELTESLLLVPAAVCSAVFPVLSRLQAGSGEYLKKAFEKTFKLLLILALPFAFGTTVLADKIILLVYKPEFYPSIIALRILIWAIAFAFLNTLMTMTLYTLNRQTTIVKLTGCMVLMNTVLNFIVIPKYSYAGASWTTVITEASCFLFCVLFIHKTIGRFAIFGFFAKSVSAAFLMAFLLWSAPWLNLFAAIGIGALFYLCLIFIFRALNAEEKNYLKDLLFSKK